MRRATTGSDLIILAVSGGAAHDGLHCYHPDGSLIGKLRLPEITTNLTFGGPQRNHLYITAMSTLYGLRVNFRAASYPG
jgi:gluconolactonase